jgi:hypothetical protein
MRGWLRLAAVALLAVALPLASLAASSTYVPCSRHAGIAPASGAQGDRCCPAADASASGADHDPECPADPGDPCACPSCLDAFAFIGASGAVAPPLSGKLVPEAVPVPETASLSEVFRPPLA